MKRNLGVAAMMMLALAGCTSQDVVIASLDAIEAAATVAVATQPSGAALTVLEAVALAVPQAIQEYESSDTLARKTVLISGNFAQALESTKGLDAQDQAVLATTVAAVQTLELQLQGLQAQKALPAAGASLGAKERKKLEQIAEDNVVLRQKIEAGLAR
jgi:hypothetical protein